ncbi:Uncharacterised protein (plasmid) [Tsukamurella tyrosinosolvens]|nr:Uncharacterised protein [Tsukamurella tyrosinosolvens]
MRRGRSPAGSHSSVEEAQRFELLRPPRGQSTCSVCSPLADDPSVDGMSWADLDRWRRSCELEVRLPGGVVSSPLPARHRLQGVSAVGAERPAAALRALRGHPSGEGGLGRVRGLRPGHAARPFDMLEEVVDPREPRRRGPGRVGGFGPTGQRPQRRTSLGCESPVAQGEALRGGPACEVLVICAGGHSPTGLGEVLKAAQRSRPAVRRGVPAEGGEALERRGSSGAQRAGGVGPSLATQPRGAPGTVQRQAASIALGDQQKPLLPRGVVVEAPPLLGRAFASRVMLHRARPFRQRAVAGNVPGAGRVCALKRGRGGLRPPEASDPPVREG